MTTVTVDMPAELRKCLELAVMLEVRLMNEDGSLPAEFEPLLEEVYRRIAARDSAADVVMSLKRLISALEESD